LSLLLPLPLLFLLSSPKGICDSPCLSAFGLEPSFRPGVQSALKALPLCPEQRRRAGAKPQAKRLIQLPLSLPFFFFFKFSPKIACQAPKPLKPLKKQELALAF
jgi:hypothetical protein